MIKINFEQSLLKEYQLREWATNELKEVKKQHEKINKKIKKLKEENEKLKNHINKRFMDLEVGDVFKFKKGGGNVYIKVYGNLDYGIRLYNLNEHRIGNKFFNAPHKPLVEKLFNIELLR